MEYDFDTPVNRRGTGSLKWDSSRDDAMLPMWVADMDFRAAPEITDALRRRVDDGVFGYVRVPDSYYDALHGWFLRRHGWEINRDDVICTPGVVPALSAIIKALAPAGSGVIFQTPAYNCFYSSVRNNGCGIIANPLLRRDTATGFSFGIDFDGLERLAADGRNRLLILCNPHNPTGRVWTRGELERVADICRRNGVSVVSDEIHCELVHHGYEYTSFATVDPEAIVCCSPSKAFNIAGLQIANIVCRDEVKRRLIDRAVNDNEVCDVNPFGVVALQAAYNRGADWLDQLNAYLDGNYRFLRGELGRRLPMLGICDSEATYLAWVDVRATGLTSDEVEQRAKTLGHVWVNSGSMYGGDGYVRINYACRRALLAEGLDRLCKSLGV